MLSYMCAQLYDISDIDIISFKTTDDVVSRSWSDDA